MLEYYNESIKMPKSIYYQHDQDSPKQSPLANFICLDGIFLIAFTITLILYLLGQMNSIYIDGKVTFKDFCEAFEIFKMIELSK